MRLLHSRRRLRIRGLFRAGRRSTAEYELRFKEGLNHKPTLDP